MLSKPFLLTGVAVTVLTALVAQAQSPFAKRGQQAWETQPAPPSRQMPAAPAPHTNSPSGTLAGSYQPYGQSSGQSAPQTQPQAQPQTLAPAYQAAPAMRGGTSVPPSPAAQYKTPSAQYIAPSPAARVPASGYSSPAPSKSPFAAPAATYQAPAYQAPSYQSAPNQAMGTGQTAPQTYKGHPNGQAGGYYYPEKANSNGYNPNRQNAPNASSYPDNYGQGNYGQDNYGMQGVQAQPSWKERMGFGRIVHKISGYFKAGAAATQIDEDFDGKNDWRGDFIADAALRGEVGAMTRSGLEYGLGLEARAQYDKYRRGFGGRVGDCDPALEACPSIIQDEITYSPRGHTSRFYAFGDADAKDTEIQLEGAYLYLRSAFGDVSLGRDDGTAYLFSLGAPSLLAVGASNNSVDYTGLDAVKTVNDASGFAEKITYTSPRLLGDTVGVGVQFGASYAPDAKACGVDYCVRGNKHEPDGVLSPDLEHIGEFAVALDRTFAGGVSVEGTVTYAMGSEKSGLDGFDDLSSLGLGLELGYSSLTLGGSYLASNNALEDGDYNAWDVGMTWQPNRWGFTAGYGQAKDKNVNLKSKQGIFGVNYDFTDNFRLGSGVQYVDRDIILYQDGVEADRSEEAISLFLEGRVTF